MLLTILGLVCKNTQPLSIYGETATLRVQNNWTYFHINFGDFGHNVEIKAKDGDQPITSIYYDYAATCPSSENMKSNKKLPEGKYLFDHPSQNANIGVYYPKGEGKDIQVSVLSGVRPIATNSSLFVIYGLFLFFSVAIFVAGVLQYFFFKNSMDPREYMPQD